MLAPTHRLSRTRLRPYLERCGYQRSLMESDVPLPLKDLLAITKDWEHTNERRARLLLKEERKTIGELEKAELEHLQLLTDVRIRLVAPLPLTELERMAADLKRKYQGRKAKSALDSSLPVTFNRTALCK